MSKKCVLFIMALTLFIGCTRQSNTASHVVTEGDKTYIVDRTGYRWDVTQAISIGFNPEKFQYGIGKDAILPLDDSGMAAADKDIPGSIRIIGVEEGAVAQAYSVQKLQSHEVINSTLGSQPIAVGYWPLSDLAAVYSREIEGTALTIAASGWTYNNTFVLYDKESGTLWYPRKKGLKGIQGTYFGRVLPKISSNDVNWTKWLKEHPESMILK